MSYTPPKYPSAIPTIEDLPDRVDFKDWNVAARYNELKKELRAALIELGTLPKGAHADVKTRLDALVGGFTDRGDPAAYDFTVGDFTTDATWRTLDLSSIVPAGAKAVSMHIKLKDELLSSAMNFRKNGNAEEYNTSTLRIQSTNVTNDLDLVVACDVNRIIEYYGSDLTFTTINLTIKGWWN